MSLEEKINNDLKAALLSGNRFEVDVLRGIKAVILDEKIALSKRDDGLSDLEVEKLLAKEVKKRKESADLYQKADRQELADAEMKEGQVLLNYLPQQLTESEIEASVKQAVAEVGASDKSQMGKVIGLVKSRLGSTADGAVIARIVKDILN